MSDDETMTIEQELCDALNTKQKKGEHRQDYLQRLVKATKKLTDDEWNALREIPTQEWVNDNMKRLSEGRDKDKKDDEIDLVDFPDRPAEDDNEMSTTHTDTNDDKPRKRPAASKSDKSEKTGKKADAGKSDKTDKSTKSEKTKDDKTSERKVASKRDATPRDAKTPGARQIIKELLIDDPTLTTDGLAALLEKKGLPVTKLACSTLRSGTLQTIRMMLKLNVDRFKELKKMDI